jgi:hypothetical protein
MSDESRGAGVQPSGDQVKAVAIAIAKWLAGLLAVAAAAYIGTAAERWRSGDELSREKREQVYTAYLDAAAEYHYAARDYSSAHYRHYVDLSPGPTNGPRDEPIYIAAHERFVTARSNYQAAVNKVYVFGSDRGWEAHERMAAVLPPSLGPYGVTFPSPEDFVEDQAEFTAAFQGIQVVMCEEVAPVARSNCAG